MINSDGPRKRWNGQKVYHSAADPLSLPQARICCHRGHQLNQVAGAADPRSNLEASMLARTLRSCTNDVPAAWHSRRCSLSADERAWLRYRVLAPGSGRFVLRPVARVRRMLVLPSCNRLVGLTVCDNASSGPSPLVPPQPRPHDPGASGQDWFDPSGPSFGLAAWTYTLSITSAWPMQATSDNGKRRQGPASAPQRGFPILPFVDPVSRDPPSPPSARPALGQAAKSSRRHHQHLQSCSRQPPRPRPRRSRDAGPALARARVGLLLSDGLVAVLPCCCASETCVF